MADLVIGLHELTGWAIEQGVDLEGLGVIMPSLEEVYLSLTGGLDRGEGGPHLVAEEEPR